MRTQDISILLSRKITNHTFPLSDYLYDLLMQRKKVATTEYVFPSSGVGSYIVELRKQMEEVIQQSGIPFIITIAEGLDISAYAVADVERLRKPMQQISDYLLKCTGWLSLRTWQSSKNLNKELAMEKLLERTESSLHLDPEYKNFLTGISVRDKNS